ncbi:transmembrane protein 267 [Uranotaenia lowii]|uniref:transmembrane protein 267 n=1 Tax=Uranotaenia lowii TaxID=190385 RepID=UPI00247AE2ED|nr:transmembrane protein 267 [Uranotaenia lowii]
MSPTVLLLIKHLLLLLVCLTGDKLLQVIQKPALLKAFADNLTHALIGLIATEIIVRNFRDQLGRTEFYLLLGFGFFLSSWIDLDHFIEARSFHLHDATNLHKRGFMHNSVIFVVLFVALLILVHVQVNFSTSTWTGIAFVAFFTHQIRDSIRRGLWFRGPYLDYSTPPVNYWLYLLLIQLCPHVIISLLELQFHRESMAARSFGGGEFVAKYKPLEVV